MATQYTVRTGDTLNAIAAKYGYTNYKTAGITGYGSSPDLIKPGMVLTINGSSSVPPAAPAAGGVATPSGAVVTPPPAAVDPAITASINAGQTGDYGAASALTAPPTRSGTQSITDIAKELKMVLTPTTQAPTPVDYEAKYLGLRTQYGVDALETKLTGLNTEADTIKSSFQAQKDAERGKPVAMGVIEGRISQEEQAANERLSAVNNQIKTVSDQLTTKYNIINNLMSYAKSTYADAKDNYDTQYTQALNLINTAKGVQAGQKNDVEAASDDARANLQVIYNNLTAGGSDPAMVNPAMQATITKLEVQAGLPAGFYSSLQQKNPKADILSTTTRTTGDAKYADVVLRNSDGSLATKSIYLGADVSSSSSGNAKNDAYGIINQLLGRRMTDGTPYTYTSQQDGKQYFTATGFRTLVSSSAESGIDRQTFIQQYANYFDPNGLDGYGLTPKEKSLIGG